LTKTFPLSRNLSVSFPNTLRFFWQQELLEMNGWDADLDHALLHINRGLVSYRSEEQDK